jgi:hypothetical protein
MKGFNRLDFNSATLIDAVQEYLDKRLTISAGKQIVQHVTPKIDGGSTIYVIGLKEKETTT